MAWTFALRNCSPSVKIVVCAIFAFTLAILFHTYLQIVTPVVAIARLILSIASSSVQSFIPVFGFGCWWIFGVWYEYASCESLNCLPLLLFIVSLFKYKWYKIVYQWHTKQSACESHYKDDNFYEFMHLAPPLVYLQTNQ